MEFRTGWNSLTKGCGRRGWWGEYRPTDADDTSFGHTSKASIEIPRAWAPPIQSMLGDFQRENSGMGAIANKSEAGGGGGGRYFSGNFELNIKKIAKKFFNFISELNPSNAKNDPPKKRKPDNTSTAKPCTILLYRGECIAEGWRNYTNTDFSCGAGWRGSDPPTPGCAYAVRSTKQGVMETNKKMHYV